jgi:hypothetical protein
MLMKREDVRARLIRLIARRRRTTLDLVRATKTLRRPLWYRTDEDKPELRRGPQEGSSNISKHGVSFDEALTVFADPLALIFHDEDHSFGEQRYHRALHWITSARGLFFGPGRSGADLQRTPGHEAGAARL